MGPMESWGDVHIGVMSANNSRGRENARLRVMASQGSQTVRVTLADGHEVVVGGADHDLQPRSRRG